MFGIGMPELLLILAVALIVIGPKKLPDLARSLGKAMGEFKRATNDLKQTIEDESGLNDVRNSIHDTKQDLQQTLDGTVSHTGQKTDESGAGEHTAPKDQTDQPDAGRTASEPSLKNESENPTDQPKEHGGS